MNTSTTSQSNGVTTKKSATSAGTAAAAVEHPIRHSVSRSNELLSCAKTAWKIRQQQHDPASPPLPVPNLQLASPADAPISLAILEEGLTLLRAMDYGAQQLQKLVRRRGHTNDPTAEISKLVQQLEQDTEELTDFCKQLLARYGRRRKQERRHWELVVQWFQQVAGKYSKQLQECLKLRGEVLAEQAQQRRKLVDVTKKKKTTATTLASGAPSRANATPLFDSPLFQQKAPPKPNSRMRAAANKVSSMQPIDGGTGTETAAANGSSTNGSNPAFSQPTNGMKRPNSLLATNGGYGASSSNGYNYSSSSGYGGYGGSSSSSSTGMRQRKTNASSASSGYGYQPFNYQQEEEHEEQKLQGQIQLRQQKRQTQQRLDEARQAETALGELSQLFGKMSSLIVQQGETLEKIEDDVEAAHADVMAGQEEIATLYQIKKGNRPLIIKTFAILIFLIIFMRAYKD